MWKKCEIMVERYLVGADKQYRKNEDYFVKKK